MKKTIDFFLILLFFFSVSSINLVSASSITNENISIVRSSKKPVISQSIQSQLLKFFEDNRFKIEVEIEEGIQQGISPEKIVDNILDMLHESGSKGRYFSGIIKKITDGSRDILYGSGQLITYPFKKVGGKISNTFCYLGSKFLGTLSWFTDGYIRKKMIFLGAFWIIKKQFKLGWWYISSKYSKKYLLYALLLATITTTSYGIKAYNIGKFIVGKLAY